MVLQDVFVLYGLGTDVGEQFLVLLEFVERACVGSEELGPQGGEEVVLGGVLGVGLARYCAGEIAELPVDGFEEGEEGEGVLQFRVDRFFEDGEEFGECALEGLPRALL